MKPRLLDRQVVGVVEVRHVIISLLVLLGLWGVYEVYVIRPATIVEQFCERLGVMQESDLSEKLQGDSARAFDDMKKICSRRRALPE